MNIKSAGIKVLLAAFILSALLIPASAATYDPWVESGSGYMINNVCIDVTVGINETDVVNNSSAQIRVYEWKDKWTEVYNRSSMSLDDSVNFSASDGNYSVRVLDFRDGMRGNVKLEIWTSANVTNNALVTGGHNEAVGSGKPELKITKTVTPQNITVGDMVTVTVYVENTGQYEAENVTITDPGLYQYPLTMVNIVTNNSYPQSFKKGENKTVLVYQLKSMEPGSITLAAATATATNSVGTQYSGYNSTNMPKVDIAEMLALVFTNQINNGTTVDYYTQSKLQGTLTIRNIGTIPAENIHIDFPLPPNAKLKIDGKEETSGLDDRQMLDIDRLMPNNERIITYTVTATAQGYYEIEPSYSYLYNGSAKSGEIDKVSYRAIGNSTIAALLNYRYFFVLPILLIAGAAVFIWKRYREYKF